jgi:hypothetical protein
MLSEVLLNMVVVEQRIVDVDQKDDRKHFAHAFAPPILLKKLESIALRREQT